MAGDMPVTARRMGERGKDESGIMKDEPGAALAVRARAGVLDLAGFMGWER